MHIHKNIPAGLLLSLLLLSYAGCQKMIKADNLTTTVIAGYRGRTWQMEQLTVSYPRFLASGQAYDSTILYKRDTTVRLFFDINWKLEIHPVLQGLLQLHGAATWAFHPGEITLVSSSDTTRCIVGDYNQGDHIYLPSVIIIAFTADTLPNRPPGSRMRVDIRFSLVGEGRFM